MHWENILDHDLGYAKYKWLSAPEYTYTYNIEIPTADISQAFATLTKNAFRKKWK